MISEVARLREQIELECEAMKQGLYGIAITAKHKFIYEKYQNLGRMQEQLEELVGKEEAKEIVVNTYIKVIG